MRILLIKKYEILFSFITLCVGGFIYIAYRTEELIMFRWAELLGLKNVVLGIRKSVSHLTMPDFVVYCLPNGLWTISYLLAVDALVDVENNKLAWAIVLPMISILFEIFQAINIIPGTYDFFDIICYLVPTVTFTIYYKLRYHEKND